MRQPAPQPRLSQPPAKMVGINWRGRTYLVPSEMEGFKANALLAAGEATRVYNYDASGK